MWPSVHHSGATKPLAYSATRKVVPPWWNALNRDAGNWVSQSRESKPTLYVSIGPPLTTHNVFARNQQGATRDSCLILPSERPACVDALVRCAHYAAAGSETASVRPNPKSRRATSTNHSVVGIREATARDMPRTPAVAGTSIIVFITRPV